ncbi:MAG: WYL domain-containing protein [Saprospiraceae bacterium]|nr:WYL domain-containing protein [Saprospiraceae bacterium]
MKNTDTTPKQKLLHILRLLLESPFAYTKRDFAQKLECSEDSIKRNFDLISDCGIPVTYDLYFRYGIYYVENNENLKSLLYLTDNDLQILNQTLQLTDAPSLQKERIQSKLNMIYDITRLGNIFLNNQYLSKINTIEKARQGKLRILLKSYRSTSSNKTEDKLLEPYHVKIKEDILYAYDVNKMAVRHYRISRIDRLELLNQPWEFEKKHKVEETDPFRITNSDQRRVRILMKIGAYNELIERFPLTLAYIKPSATLEDHYELDCLVNAQFYGLSNFIMGYHDHIVSIEEPESLITHLQQKTESMKKHFFN